MATNNRATILWSISALVLIWYLGYDFISSGVPMKRMRNILQKSVSGFVWVQNGQVGKMNKRI